MNKYKYNKPLYITELLVFSDKNLTPDKNFTHLVVSSDKNLTPFSLQIYIAGHGINSTLIESDINSTLGFELRTSYRLERNNRFIYQDFFTFEEVLYSDDLNLSFKF